MDRAKKHLFALASFLCVSQAALGQDALEEALRRVPDTTLINDVADSQARSAWPDSVVKAVEQALRANPDLLVAQAKLAQAEADMVEAELNLTHDVTLAFLDFEAARKTLRSAEEVNQRTPGSYPGDALAQRQTELAEAEARCIYLLGLGRRDRNPELDSFRRSPPKLAEAIAYALRENGVLRRVAAEAEAARAALNQTRLAVTRDVTITFTEWELAKRAWSEIEPAVSGEDRRKAMLALATSEAQLAYLLGDNGYVPRWDKRAQPAGVEREDVARASPPSTAAAAQPSPQQTAPGRPEPGRLAIPDNLPERFRERLAVKFDDFSVTQTALKEVARDLSEKLSLPFVVLDDADVSVTISLKNVTAAEMLEAIGDVTEYCFVVRDYGILVVPSDVAARKYVGAPRIPSD